ncbi:hypothetical protein QFC22_006138 [Naganishia vaughanmartiniae]|uniref:Uncharacterized protein n=1 Tax=Naganishia vaughanmartiniae TaxID=1424756 RepID=A0ACC2WR71_9TREE|nr:hypothetical protein QFC22_006138 [Naganishia vaughanmartiniae]
MNATSASTTTPRKRTGDNIDTPAVQEDMKGQMEDQILGDMEHGMERDMKREMEHQIQHEMEHQDVDQGVEGEDDASGGPSSQPSVDHAIRIKAEEMDGLRTKLEEMMAAHSDEMAEKTPNWNTFRRH